MVVVVVDRCRRWGLSSLSSRRCDFGLALSEIFLVGAKAARHLSRLEFICGSCLQTFHSRATPHKIRKPRQKRGFCNTTSSMNLSFSSNI